MLRYLSKYLNTVGFKTVDLVSGKDSFGPWSAENCSYLVQSNIWLCYIMFM